MFACGDFGELMRTFQANALLSDATIQLAVANLVGAVCVLFIFFPNQFFVVYFQVAREASERAEASKQQQLEMELQVHGLPPFSSLTAPYRQVLDARIGNLKSGRADDPLMAAEVAAAVQECIAMKDQAQAQYTAWLGSAAAAEFENERAADALPSPVSRVGMQMDRIHWFSAELKKETAAASEDATAQPRILWFPVTLDSKQRLELHDLAQSLGLASQSEGFGYTRRLTVFKRA
jgi:hypothetical protein